MITRAQWWGNSHSLRLGKKLLADVEIDVGDEVDVAVRDGALVVTPVRRVRCGRSRAVRQGHTRATGRRSSIGAPRSAGRSGGWRPTSRAGRQQRSVQQAHGSVHRLIVPSAHRDHRLSAPDPRQAGARRAAADAAAEPGARSLIAPSVLSPPGYTPRRRGAARTVGAAGQRGGRVVWQISCRIDAVKPPRLGSSEFERVGGEATERPESPACGDTRARTPSEAVRWWEERPTALTLG